MKAAQFQPPPIGTAAEDGQDQVGQDRAPARPASQAWISDGLIAETRRVWLNEFGRIVTDAEAVEILSNFKRLAEVLLRIKADQRRQT